MRVLFYADPAKTFEHYVYSAALLQDHLLNFCGKALLRSGKVEVKAIISEIVGFQKRGSEWLAGLETIEFPIRLLKEIFPGCRSMNQILLRYFKGEMDGDERARFEAAVQRLLGSWLPDVVIAYPTQAAAFRSIFPNALCLTVENGIFSRSPFPRTLRFEPVDFMNGFLNRYRDEIWNFPVDESQRAQVEAFRRRLSDWLAAHCSYARELRELRKRFRHLVLCPVPTANFYGEAEWDDQFLWLTDCMDRIAPDIGVIITFHDDVAAQLNWRTLEFFRARYPNLLVFNKRANALQSSQFFPFVDAILNCETMTGTQGMLVCPRIVSLDRTYSGWMADASGLENLSEVLERPARDRTGLIYWYLTHFTVCETMFDDSDRYVGFFRERLEFFRREGVKFGLCGPINRFGEVSELLFGRFESFDAEMRARHARRHSPILRISRNIGRWLVRMGEKLVRFGGD